MTKHILLPSTHWESTVQTLLPAPAVKCSLPDTHKAKGSLHLPLGHRNLSTARNRRIRLCTDVRADVGLNRNGLLLCLWQSVTGTMVNWWMLSVAQCQPGCDQPKGRSFLRCKCCCVSTSQIISVLLILWHWVCTLHTRKKSSTWQHFRF